MCEKACCCRLFPQVADLRSKEIRYYDSMGGSNDKCLAALKQYLADEHMDKKKAAYDVSEWKTISLPANVGLLLHS